MKAVDLAYMAGIVDGEGCIAIERYVSKGHGYYRAKLRVANTNKELLEFLKLYFGGTISNFGKRSPNQKPAYMWAIPGETAIKCIKALLPYLFLKRPQAQLAIKFQSKKRGKGYYKTPKELAVEEAQYILAKGLNKRGV